MSRNRGGVSNVPVSGSMNMLLSLWILFIMVASVMTSSAMVGGPHEDSSFEMATTADLNELAILSDAGVANVVGTHFYSMYNDYAAVDVSSIAVTDAKAVIVIPASADTTTDHKYLMMPTDVTADDVINEQVWWWNVTVDVSTFVEKRIVCLWLIRSDGAEKYEMYQDLDYSPSSGKVFSGADGISEHEWRLRGSFLSSVNSMAKDDHEWYVWIEVRVWPGNDWSSDTVTIDFDTDERKTENDITHAGFFFLFWIAIFGVTLFFMTPFGQLPVSLHKTLGEKGHGKPKRKIGGQTKFRGLFIGSLLFMMVLSMVALPVSGSGGEADEALTGDGDSVMYIALMFFFAIGAVVGFQLSPNKQSGHGAGVDWVNWAGACVVGAIFAVVMVSIGGHTMLVFGLMNPAGNYYGMLVLTFCILAWAVVLYGLVNFLVYKCPVVEFKHHSS